MSSLEQTEFSELDGLQTTMWACPIEAFDPSRHDPHHLTALRRMCDYENRKEFHFPQEQAAFFADRQMLSKIHDPGENGWKCFPLLNAFDWLGPCYLSSIWRL